MKRIKQIVVLVVLALAAFAGWRVGSCEVANLEFQEDLHDLASRSSFRFGNAPPRSEDDMREAVIRKAGEYGIELSPQQVTVRPGSNPNAAMFLAADYDVPVNLPRVSFTLHFTPSSEKSTF